VSRCLSCDVSKNLLYSLVGVWMYVIVPDLPISQIIPSIILHVYHVGVSYLHDFCMQFEFSVFYCTAV
jgi:hypothetical protein